MAVRSLNGWATYEQYRVLALQICILPPRPRQHVFWAHRHNLRWLKPLQPAKFLAERVTDASTSAGSVGCSLLTARQYWQAARLLLGKNAQIRLLLAPSKSPDFIVKQR